MEQKQLNTREENTRLPGLDNQDLLQVAIQENRELKTTIGKLNNTIGELNETIRLLIQMLNQTQGNTIAPLVAPAQLTAEEHQYIPTVFPEPNQITATAIVAEPTAPPPPLYFLTQEEFKNFHFSSWELFISFLNENAARIVETATSYKDGNIVTVKWLLANYPYEELDPENFFEMLNACKDNPALETALIQKYAAYFYSCGPGKLSATLAEYKQLLEILPDEENSRSELWRKYLGFIEKKTNYLPHQKHCMQADTKGIHYINILPDTKQSNEEMYKELLNLLNQNEISSAKKDFIFLQLRFNNQLIKNAALFAIQDNPKLIRELYDRALLLCAPPTDIDIHWEESARSQLRSLQETMLCVLTSNAGQNFWHQLSYSDQTIAYLSYCYLNKALTKPWQIEHIGKKTSEYMLVFYSLIQYTNYRGITQDTQKYIEEKVEEDTFAKYCWKELINRDSNIVTSVNLAFNNTSQDQDNKLNISEIMQMANDLLSTAYAKSSIRTLFRSAADKAQQNSTLFSDIDSYEQLYAAINHRINLLVLNEPKNHRVLFILFLLRHHMLLSENRFAKPELKATAAVRTPEQSDIERALSFPPPIFFSQTMTAGAQEISGAPEELPDYDTDGNPLKSDHDFRT